MTGRLSDVEARIGSAQQLSAVVTAMRGIAAARSHEARTHLEGIRTYSEAIGNAISRALSFLPSQPITTTAAEPGHAIIAISAGQGFAGTFSEHVLDAAVSMMERDTQCRLLLIGDRGLMIAAERNLTVEWSAPMAAHVARITDLANRIVEALYDRLETGVVSRVTLVHTTVGRAGELEISRRPLLPFDYLRFPPSQSAQPPLITLPPQRLLSQLAEEYVFAEICEALTLSFAAENEARTRSMIAAKANVGKTLDGLVSLSRQLRQEEITNEIIELAAGSA